MYFPLIRGMQRIFESFFAGVFALALLFASNAQADGLNVVVYGDSIVSGMQLQTPQAYPARLADKMREVGYTDLNIVNMAAEGMTSSVGVDRLNLLLEQKPDVAIVAFGADDVERGVSVEQSYNNLAVITGKLVQSGVYVILVGMKAPPTLTGGYVSQFENMFRIVATSRKTMLVNDILEGVVGNPQLTLADDLHPNSRGVDVMVENSFRYVDTCVRSKIQAAQYQQEYRSYQQNMARPAGR